MKTTTLAKALLAAGILCSGSAAFSAADAALVNARIKFFGPENVDPATGLVKKDKVVFSWLGHNAGAVSLLGRVIMLESYIPRLEVTPGRTPFVIRDLVELKPEAIFIGHGHSDHADNAAFIAAKTGATLYMTPEACGTAQTALNRMKNDPYMQADAFFAIAPSATVKCVGVTSAGSVPGTEVVRIKQFEPLVCINGFRALHSTSVAADPDWGPVPVVDTPDPRDQELFPAGVRLTPSNPRLAGQQDLRQGSGPGGADQLDFQFTLRTGYNFTIFYNNSIGAFKEGKGSNWPNGTPADGQRVLNLMRSLPNTDLNFSSLSSGNTDNNGWRDHVYHAEALRPKILTSGHAPVGASLQYYSGFMNHLKLMEQPRNAWPGFPKEDWPIVRNHTDPTDLLKPEVYQPGDPAWYHPQKAARVAQFCS
ncbi:hypothetical protein V4F39_04815 [Aquincola sp. MAHUQ-54]|uniref:MBL fold metallo-hydrolase n=1 Tax=Aquincola agrisoli TaxID=3119538 RepID=A0AAW9QF43_9BURK